MGVLIVAQVEKAIFRGSEPLVDYVNPGPNVVNAGDVIVFATGRVGVATHYIPVGALGALTTGMHPTFEMLKYAHEAIALGATIYWDAIDQVATATSSYGAGSKIGWCKKAALATDQTVWVALTDSEI